MNKEDGHAALSFPVRNCTNLNSLEQVQISKDFGKLIIFNQRMKIWQWKPAMNIRIILMRFFLISILAFGSILK